jgi:hypothetical protein
MSSPEFNGNPEQSDEWHRQELARQAERHTVASSADLRRDADVAKYRLIDRALRVERDGLPENFAARTGAFVDAASRAASDRLEIWLQRAAIVALIIAAIVTVFVVGGRGLAALAALPGAAWGYSVALCVGLSLALQHLGKRWMMKGT